MNTKKQLRRTARRTAREIACQHIRACLTIGMILAGVLSLPGVAAGQIAPLHWEEAIVTLDSGPVAVPPDAEPRPHIVFSDVVGSPDADWIRLQFGDVRLAGSLLDGSNARIRLTSLKDGAQQHLDAHSLHEWRHSSAYFNGSWVLVEVISHPKTGASRVVIDHIQVGVHNDQQPINACDNVDTRVPWDGPDPTPDARILPEGCTGFLIGERCLLTAGHCTSTCPGGSCQLDPSKMQVVEFNVPFSNEDGSINFADPKDQYPVHTDSIQWFLDTSGPDYPFSNDWAYFGVFDNAETGLSPYGAQQATYTLASDVPDPIDQCSDPQGINDQCIRIRGFGKLRPGVTGPPEQENTWSQTLLYATGPFVESIDPNDPYLIMYQVDTEGGNSGSAVYLDGEVIGIHTDGGCNQVGGNRGTAITNSGLQAALADPQGVCRAIPSAIHVPGDHSTIQAAINAATYGQIIVAPGTYEESIDFNGKAIQLISTHGPGETTIQAPNTHFGPVVTCSSGEGASTVLHGFTITGGTATDGGGMYISGSNPTVSNCIFHNNAASEQGGAIFNSNASPWITNCTFADNTAEEGAGIFSNGGSPTVTNSTFERNVADSGVRRGGGMFNHESSPTVRNSTFADNEAEQGAGMYNSSSNPNIHSTTFVDNLASNQGGGLYSVGEYPDAQPSWFPPIHAYARVRNCVFIGNSAGNAGGGIFVAPTLGSGPGISDTLFCENSPSHISGSWDDLDGNAFHTDCPECVGDLNDDGVVNVFDLLILLAEWGECADPRDCPADLNGDGVVNVHDLLILLANWGPCFIGEAVSSDVQECYDLYSDHEARLIDCLENLE